LPNDVPEAEAAFDARVRARFAIGTAEDVLISEIAEQGFKLTYRAMDGLHDATFYRRRFPFTTLWSIRWKSEAGRITEIWGVFGIRGP
jgi:hypothetical protein